MMTWEPGGVLSMRLELFPEMTMVFGPPELRMVSEPAELLALTDSSPLLKTIVQMFCGQPEMLNRTVSSAAVEFAASIAALRLPAPLSFVFATV